MRNVGTEMQKMNLFSQSKGSNKLLTEQPLAAEEKSFSNVLLKNEKIPLNIQGEKEKQKSESPIPLLLDSLIEEDSYIVANSSNIPHIEDTSVKTFPNSLTDLDKELRNLLSSLEEKKQLLPQYSGSLNEKGKEAKDMLGESVTSMQIPLPASLLEMISGRHPENGVVKVENYDKNGLNTFSLPSNLMELTEDLQKEAMDIKAGQKNAVIPGNSIEKLLEQVSLLLSEANEGKLSSADSKTLLNLLGQWKEMGKQAGKTVNLEQFIKHETTVLDKKAATVWIKLTETYQKRTGMEYSSKYQAEASVTSSDISKWLKQALVRYENDGAEDAKPLIQQSSPMVQISKVEQFTIHMQQTGNKAADDQKLLQEFQRVLNSSRFIQSNGSTELLLKLRPANLGEVLVKMVEVNGEMLVKISVASQAAKEALEGNLTQLRHMFSPSQVLIEKQETNFLMEESYQPDADKGELNDQSFAEDETSEPSISELEEENESASFHDYLTAEKEQVI